ncbi:MAG TPA: hypothetical protein VFC84_01020 [Desulfosporosinus sp.]|nr:hypothetical protein [Desulfosporosinus sp.]
MARKNENGLGNIGFRVTTPIMALIAIVFGIFVIAFKDLLQWIVGLYFIIQGILFLVEYLEQRRRYNKLIQD